MRSRRGDLGGASSLGLADDIGEIGAVLPRCRCRALAERGRRPRHGENGTSAP